MYTDVFVDTFRKHGKHKQNNEKYMHIFSAKSEDT
jgi:hypothetical protein